jgi:hypothetical protein
VSRLSAEHLDEHRLWLGMVKPLLTGSTLFHHAGLPRDVPVGPANLTAITGDQQVALSWDSTGVAGCRVSRNISQISQTATTSYSNTGLTDRTTYSCTVVAYDGVGTVAAHGLPFLRLRSSLRRRRRSRPSSGERP